jgi:hypothetical protein
MRASVVLLVLVALLPACNSCGKKERGGEGEPKTAPTAAADSPGARYRAVLGRARSHEVRGEFSEAAAAYREALTLSPGAPRALDALARALLGAGDLPAALAAATEATERAVDARSAAMAHFTRYRVLSKQGDVAEARRALRRSHDLLPRGETVKALEGEADLDKIDLLTPLPVEGPLALADLCKGRAPDPAPAGWTCDPDQGRDDVGINKLDPVTGPFAEARLFEVGTPARSDCLLAMRTDAQWWVLDLLPGCRSATTSIQSKDLAIAQPQTGGPPHLVSEIEVTARWSEISPDGLDSEVEDIDRFTVLCSVGPSKVPTCTPHIPLSSRRTVSKGGTTTSHEFNVDIGFGETGGLKLAYDDPQSLDKAVRELLGVHLLDWR